MGAVPEEAKQQSRSPATAATVVIFMVLSCEEEQMLSIGKVYFLSELLASPSIVCARVCVCSPAWFLKEVIQDGLPTFFVTKTQQRLQFIATQIPCLLFKNQDQDEFA